MVFKVGDNDYSSSIIVDTYNVNAESIFKEWEDANGTIHRSEYRKRILGTFDMQFRTLAEYQQFIQTVEQYKRDGAVDCTVAVNNYDANVLSRFYLTFAPSRSVYTNYTKFYSAFTVNVEER